MDVIAKLILQEGFGLRTGGLDQAIVGEITQNRAVVSDCNTLFCHWVVSKVCDSVTVPVGAL